MISTLNEVPTLQDVDVHQSKVHLKMNSKKVIIKNLLWLSVVFMMRLQSLSTYKIMQEWYYTK